MQPQYILRIELLRSAGSLTAFSSCPILEKNDLTRRVFFNEL